VLLRPLGLLFVVALSSAIGPAKAGSEPVQAVRPPAPKEPDPAAPKRAKVTCEQYRANAEAHAKQAVFNTKLKAGAWGRIPAPLRKLPPRAKLCGADGIGQVVIASPLFGKDIESHYTPLFTKIGFKPLACKVVGRRTQCTCKRHRDIGVVVTDEDSEAFVLAVMKR
jgi:hypothetical protein